MTFNGIKVCAGIKGVDCPTSPSTIHFSVGATSGVTAGNFVASFTSSALTNIYATATFNTAGQIDIISRYADGIAYKLATTSPTLMSTGGNMGLGVAATVFSATDKITLPGTGFTTGLPVLLTGAVQPGALTATTTYYAYKVDANTIKLSSTSALAQAGTGIDITSVAVGATAHTMTLTPLTIDGTPGFSWQVSNDGAYWTNLSVTSVTMSGYTAGGATSYWDFSWFDFNWLRLNVIGPTTGGILLKANLVIKN